MMLKHAEQYCGIPMVVLATVTNSTLGPWSQVERSELGSVFHHLLVPCSSLVGVSIFCRELGIITVTNYEGLWGLNEIT